MPREKLTLKIGDQRCEANLDATRVEIGGRRFPYRIEKGSRNVQVMVAGKVFRAEVEEVGIGRFQVILDGQPLKVSWEELRAKLPALAGKADAAGRSLHEVAAPMPGKIVRIVKQVGETVAAGDVVLTLEAMKMENEISTNVAGMVKNIRVSEGASVASGDILFVIEEEG